MTRFKIWIGRLFFPMFVPILNHFTKTVLGRGFEEGKINSKQLHELAAICDRLLAEWSK